MPLNELPYYIFQKLSGPGCQPKGPLNGHCSVSFYQGTEEIKFKNTLKYKKCFVPYRKDVRKISGNFVNDSLEV